MPVMRILKKNLADEVIWQYDSEVLRHDENSITVEAFFNRDDMPFQEIVLKRNDRFVETFYTDKWYNIFEIYDRDDGKLKGWYCNITTPAVIEDGSISYVDLALDLWVTADGEQTVLDEDELEDLGLGDLKGKALAGLRELQILFESKNPPP
jgi:uncharacterized protein